MSEFDEIEAVQIVRPGETLVIKVGRNTTHERFGELSGAIRSQVPEDVKVLILGGDMDFAEVMATKDADRIAEAVRKATENPGKSFEVDQ